VLARFVVMDGVEGHGLSSSLRGLHSGSSRWSSCSRTMAVPSAGMKGACYCKAPLLQHLHCGAAIVERNPQECTPRGDGAWDEHPARVAGAARANAPYSCGSRASRLGRGRIATSMETSSSRLGGAATSDTSDETATQAPATLLATAASPGGPARCGRRLGCRKGRIGQREQAERHCGAQLWVGLQRPPTAGSASCFGVTLRAGDPRCMLSIDAAESAARPMEILSHARMRVECPWRVCVLACAPLSPFPSRVRAC
jgi:hypothetical protein